MDSQPFKVPYGTQELKTIAEKKERFYQQAQSDLDDYNSQYESKLKILGDLKVERFEKENELFTLKHQLEESERKQSAINDQVIALKNMMSDLNDEKEKFEEETCRENDAKFNAEIVSIFERVGEYREIFDEATVNGEYESLKKKNVSLVQELDDAMQCLLNIKKSHVLDKDLDMEKSLKALKEIDDSLKKQVEEMRQQTAKLKLRARYLESQKSLYSM